MSLNLTYGNKPAARGRIRLGQNIRTIDLNSIVKLQHEMWANSGESFGGMIYKTDINPLITTLTTFNFGIGVFNLARFQPFTSIDLRHRIGDESTIHFSAFGDNIEVQVEVLDSTYSVKATFIATATSSNSQWVSNNVVITGLNADDIVGIRVKFRRLGFDTQAVLRHFAAICRPNLESQIPI